MFHLSPSGEYVGTSAPAQPVITNSECRVCIQCRRQISSYQPVSWKRCQHCRSENRERKKMNDIRNEQFQQRWAREMAENEAREKVEGMSSKRKAEDLGDIAKITDTSKRNKNDGEDARAKVKNIVAIQVQEEVASMLTNDANRSAMRHQPLGQSSAQIVAATTANLGQEYQSSTLLYQKLREKLEASQRITFVGCYSTVVAVQPPAVPTKNAQRIRLVSSELKSISKLLHSHTLKRNETSTASMRSYCCECSGSPSVAAATAPQNTSKSVSGQPSGSLTFKVAKCGGVVEICVEDDHSHWLPDIEGQKVTISVNHPK